MSVYEDLEIEWSGMVSFNWLSALNIQLVAVKNFNEKFMAGAVSDGTVKTS